MCEAFLGVDLGTSSVKVTAVGEDGHVLATVSQRYKISRPQERWAEQDPGQWWSATVAAIREILAKTNVHVLGVGVTGQMHGLVLLDPANQPVRPAIIWPDGRAAEQVQQWRDIVGDDEVRSITGFPIAAGMMGVSLSWIRDHEPGVYQRAAHAVFPKDYLRMRLTGVLSTEPTDIGGGLLYDIHALRPAESLVHRLDLRQDLLSAEIFPTLGLVGNVTSRASDETGLRVGAPVASGGGDSAMAAVALGLHDASRAALMVSSGGLVIKRTAGPLEPTTGLHVLRSAQVEQWLGMGVVLSAGLGVDWLSRKVYGMDGAHGTIAKLAQEADTVPPGAGGLLFTPHLGGTRTPVVDSSRRGSIVGLGFDHDRAHILRAMVEGVSISLASSLSKLEHCGEPATEVVLSGGGARLALWRNVLADVLGRPVGIDSESEHAGIGAAMTAAIAIGRGIEQPSSYALEIVEPDPSRVEDYREIAIALDSVEQVLHGS